MMASHSSHLTAEEVAELIDSESVFDEEEDTDEVFFPGSDVEFEDNLDEVDTGEAATDSAQEAW